MSPRLHLFDPINNLLLGLNSFSQLHCLALSSGLSQLKLEHHGEEGEKDETQAEHVCKARRQRCLVSATFIRIAT